jgi:hypothetical protein
MKNKAAVNYLTGGFVVLPPLSIYARFFITDAIFTKQIVIATQEAICPILAVFLLD